MMIPRQLLDKYNQSLPRYTSYPPANFFNAEMDSDKYSGLIKASNHRQPENISLYIHIPFCKKICHYCGCNSVGFPSASTIKEYINALMKEIAMVRSLLGKGRKVSQLHYGGGTPNAINIEYIEQINELIFNEFEFIDKPEIAIECHPAHLTEEYMVRLVKSGFNRFSLGIQDIDPKVLKTANRQPGLFPPAHYISFLKGLDHNIKVNFDFIYGLPHQTPEGFTKTMKAAVACSPDRIVTFSYAHVPWFKKHQMVLEKAGLPDAEQKVLIFEAACKELLENGYHSIGMDHYALKDDELLLALQKNELHRNFQGYCTRRTTGQVYAFGVSSISQLHDSYIQNTKDIVEYIRRIGIGEFAAEKGYVLDFHETVIREVINHIMCNRSMMWKDISDSFSITEAELKEIIKFDPTKLDPLVADGLVTINAQGITITDKGRFFIRNIAVAFDPAMENSSGKKFSKSV